MSTLEKLIDPIRTTGTRAGNTIDRVGKMNAAGVSHKAIAAQLSSGSAKGRTYSAKDVGTLVALYEDCRTKVPVTASQTKSLIADRSNNPVLVPA